MKKEEIEFLHTAKMNGYAKGPRAWVKESDGTTSTRFKRGSFSFHDNWDGGEPFGGRERLTIDGKPYWIMVYHGAVEIPSDGVIPTLQAALSNLPSDFPARGPKEFQNGEYLYLNDWKGTIDRFSGEEKILYNGEQAYSASYAGGLVNVVKD